MDMGEKSLELRHCPFCNGTDVEVVDSVETLAVRCNECLARGSIARTRTEAVRAWNGPLYL